MISASMVKDLREKTGAGMMDCKKALEEAAGDMDKAIDYLREKGITKAAKKTDRIAAEGLTNIFIKDNKAVILEVNSETDFVAKNADFKKLVNKIGNTILASDVKSMDSALELNTGEGTINELIVNETATIGEKLSFRRFEVIEKKDNEVFGPYLHMGGKISSLVVISGDNESIAKDLAMQSAAMKPLYMFKENVPTEVLEHEKEVLKEQAINEGKPTDIAEKMVNGRISKYYKEVCLNEQQFVKDNDLTIEMYLKNNDCKLINMIRYEVGEGMEKRDDNFADEVMSQIKNS